MTRESEERLREIGSALANAARANNFIVRGNYSPDGIKEAQNVRILQATHLEIGLAIRAYLELYEVLADTKTTGIMSRRFPWGKSIKRSDHFKLVWFQFTNLCYLFREKSLLLHNRCARIARMTGRAVPANHKDVLKQIDKYLGGHIKSRGSTFHEWYQHHQEVYSFTLIETLADIDVDQWSGQLMDHYKELKYILGMDISAAIGAMEGCLFGSIDRYRQFIIESMELFTSVYRHLQRDEAMSQFPDG